MIAPLLKLLEQLVHYAPLATLAAIYVIYRVVMQVRTNDLAHIDEKINALHDAITERANLLDRRIEHLDLRLDKLSE